jgi:hypothetical protein
MTGVRQWWRPVLACYCRPASRIVAPMFHLETELPLPQVWTN